MTNLTEYLGVIEQNISHDELCDFTFPQQGRCNCNALTTTKLIAALKLSLEGLENCFCAEDEECQNCNIVRQISEILGVE